MTADWSREKCLALIDDYEKRPEIWNPHHQNYYNKEIKQVCWESLARKFGVSTEDIRKKMDSLLSSFRREKAKSKKCFKGSSKLYISRWFAFDRMTFLNGKEGRTLQTSEDENLTVYEPEEVFLEEPTSEVDNLETPNQVQYISEESSQTFVSPVPSRLKKTNKRKRLTLDQDNTKIEEAFRILKNTATKVATPTDESSVYGQHVANKLRKYDQQTRAIVEYRINNILFKADMRQYDAEIGRLFLNSNRRTQQAASSSRSEDMDDGDFFPAPSSSFASFNEFKTE